ncbi:MAG: gamma-glutamyltransferase [Rhodovibrionaceae bacterium]
MLNTPQGFGGMVTAPHHLAAQSGLSVLRDGGNAIEAAVAAAATIAVVYPHMNALGGDNFWLIHEAGSGDGPAPRAISGCGTAGAGVTPDFYRSQGLDQIPLRGPMAVNTVAGAVGGWQKALEISAHWGGALPLSRLLEDAILYAAEGMPMTASQVADTLGKLEELREQPGFASTFLPEGRGPTTGTRLRQPSLAATLQQLVYAGFDDFYRGDLSRLIAEDFDTVGSPLYLEDLTSYQAEEVAPLSVEVKGGRLFNHPPPTQGLASLILLALYNKRTAWEAESFDFYHAMVEATKQAFQVRDTEIADPGAMTKDPASFLEEASLARMATAMHATKAAPWPAKNARKGDTIWLGVVDGEGRAVSLIQSVFWEFGSGVVLPQSGLLWQNRGASFTLKEGDLNAVAPGKKPIHTLNPALCLFEDGRVMPYGCMGGEGQPQTQAAVFARYALHDIELQQAVNAPRWLLGRAWGEEKTGLSLEARVDDKVVAELKKAGHQVELVGEFDSLMGHAGALVRHPDGLIEGAADPRSDGCVAAY